METIVAGSTRVSGNKMSVSHGKAEHMTDEMLMKRYVAANDEAAFQKLFQRYRNRLGGLFVQSIGCPSTAADLVQQTFLHVHRGRNNFKLDAPFRPWLYAIAKNVRREYYRQRARKPEVQLDLAVHGEPTVGPRVSTPTERAVRRALTLLPEKQREAIELHWYHDMTFREIAERVGASVAAVKVRAHRGYDQLRAMELAAA